MPALARRLRLSGRAGRDGRTDRHDPRPRFPRLGAAPARLPPLLRHGSRLLARRLAAAALQAASGPAAAVPTRAGLADDRFYAFLERTWMLQQAALGGCFLADRRAELGGLGRLRAGRRLSDRPLARRPFRPPPGRPALVVDGAAVQGYDVAFAGLISMGESWHNNHHAFPGSAKLGLFPGEADLGWLLIKVFLALGLAWDIVTPERLPSRPELRAAPRSASGDRGRRPRTGRAVA